MVLSSEVMSTARDMVSGGNIQPAAILLDRFVREYPRHQKARRALSAIRRCYLLTDDDNPLFSSAGMQYAEFHSDYNQIRFYAMILTQNLPEAIRQDRLIEQQLSEIVKNAIKHGNQGQIRKKIRVWYEHQPHIRYIVEDEGPGMANIEEWNAFNFRRRTAIRTNDMENLLQLLAYKSADSEENDGGNSLFAGLEFWDEGMIYNARRNKVVVVKYL